jgi:DNA-binding transcriptional LysR family regulator
VIGDGKTFQAQPQIRMRANNGEVLACAAVAGMGITAGPTFILGPYLKEGKLQRILGDYRRPSVGIFAVTPPGRLLPQRVQRFIEFLFSRFGDQPYWDKHL